MERAKEEELKKKDATNKAKNPDKDSELDGPKEEELIPDKLAKVHQLNYLGKTIRLVGCV